MIAETTQRQVVIFTGRGASPSTIELIETISHAFPHWHFTILQEIKPRRWVPYLSGKIRRLGREPFSYPLELLGQLLRRLRLPSTGRVTDAAALPRSYTELVGANVSHHCCASFSDPNVLANIANLNPWLGIALSAPILKPQVFAIPQRGTLNLHKSLLPNYRGMPPGFWELHDGTSESGVSVHWVDEELDTGSIVCQKTLEIPAYATCAGLSARLDALSHEVLLEALRHIEVGEDAANPQQTATTPTRGRPTWLVRRAVRRRLRLASRRSWPTNARCRELAKQAFFAVYVYLWAPCRNLYRRLMGTCRTTVLLYHRVSDDHLDSVTVGVEQFIKHVRLLRRRYDVMDLPAFLANRGQPRRRPGVVITFDDGYEDNHLAARLLRRAGLPCTFFLSTRIVGSDRGFEHDLKKLGKAVPALRWEQVRQMANWGFHFGNHTADHANIGKIPLPEALDQIEKAQRDLTDHLAGARAREAGLTGCAGGSSRFAGVLAAMAYPFGRPSDITPEVRQALDTAGFDCCLSAY
ncbi:MAG: polysaccharide deacetylase family protein, partial [Planctomycetes bacterium]|nr:polysaccharide deacetylase family protein [Planctomycetota bacterium]